MFCFNYFVSIFKQNVCDPLVALFFNVKCFAVIELDHSLKKIMFQYLLYLIILNRWLIGWTYSKIKFSRSKQNDWEALDILL